MVVAGTCPCGTVRSQMAAPSGCKPRTISLLKVSPTVLRSKLSRGLSPCYVLIPHSGEPGMGSRPLAPWGNPAVVTVLPCVGDPHGGWSFSFEVCCFRYTT